MANKKLDANVAAETYRVWIEEGKNTTHTAQRMGLPRSTVQARIDRYHHEVPGTPATAVVTPTPSREFELRDRIKTLETTLAGIERETLDATYVKRKILELAEQPVEPPTWLIEPHKTDRAVGVPTLFLSDLHWGEIVDPNQIGGVNQYKLETAHNRMRRCVEKAVSLLTNHITTIEYPGIVLIFGGDMVSGDIHEELMATNEKEIMPTVVDLWGALAWAIETLADTFGNVFVPCVTGNHGRNTHKIRAKGRNFTSFDWLVYQFLAKRFEGDKRVQFLIPDGPDAYYRVFEHRYLLTHGDQFRGGDGLIGALGPIIRGDHKKRSRNAQIGMEFDTMLLGHWHQLIQLKRLIVNGSMVGYNEYAYSNSFGYEPPQQGLWINSPGHGITFSMPVHLGETHKAPETEWVSWK